MLLRLEGIAKQFGPRILFENVQLDIRPGDRIGLVGPNGAGKSTLLGIAAGDDTPDSGRVLLGPGTKVEQLRQEIDPSRPHSVREEVATVYAHLDAHEAEIRSLEETMAKLGEVPHDVADRYDHLHHEFDQAAGYERHSRINRTLAGLGFDDEAQSRPLSSFSGGWLMRVELAKLLLREPDVLLLDEPTNHLDLPSIRWFENMLDEFRGAALIVSHDRTFLRRHVNRIAELETKSISVYEGNYDRYLEQRGMRREQLEAQKRTQDRKIAETERFVDRFRAKASKAKQVQSRVKSLEKIERVELIEDENRRMRIRIPKPLRSGDKVIELEGVHKSYGDNHVYDGIDLLVRRGERISLAGPNGAGKSTLLKIIAGGLEFDSGERTLGHNVEVGFFAQHQLDSLDLKRSVYEELEASAQFDDIPRLRGHLAAFLFPGDDIQKKISVLSGGEKSRVALAKMLLRPVNFLVLDEPTNHLDVAAREVLEEALQGYQGTLVFISHDRTFINALATRVIRVIDGQLRNFPGNYDAYLEKINAEQAAKDSEQLEASAKKSKDQPKPGKKARKQKQAQDRAKRRMQKIEDLLAELEAAIIDLDQKLADPEIYSSPEACRKIEEYRGELNAKIETLTTEWDSLTELAQD